MLLEGEWHERCLRKEGKWSRVRLEEPDRLRLERA